MGPRGARRPGPDPAHARPGRGRPRRSGGLDVHPLRLGFAVTVREEGRRGIGGYRRAARCGEVHHGAGGRSRRGRERALSARRTDGGRGRRRAARKTLMIINVKWAENTSELKAALKSGTDQIHATRAAAEKMVQALSGDNLIAAAHRYTAAVN